jgi:2-polyprenyl-3-methyl-5-hydroxy-6-metoxy-1,4-benzoquinol methylase
MINTNFREAQAFVDHSRSLNQESLSGPGSSIANTVEVRNLLHKCIFNYNIKSILDLGCGDWNWLQNVCLDGVNYLGWDADVDLIVSNLFNYSEDNITFDTLDICLEEYPSVDLIICRDVLFHMPINLAQKIINKSKKSCKLFLSTSFLDVKINTGIQSGLNWGYYPINLNAPPFNLSDLLLDFDREMLGASNDSIILSPKRYICLYDFSNF